LLHKGLDCLLKIGNTEIMSDYLFARPSVLEGIGRNVDFFGILNCYNKSPTKREADFKALKNDLEVLKQDFNIAYGKVMQN
jgi:hypothetical protein